MQQTQTCVADIRQVCFIYTYNYKLVKRDYIKVADSNLGLCDSD